MRNGYFTGALLIVATVVLNACGSSVSQTTNYTAPQNGLPDKVVAGLSSYKMRLHDVSKLPLTDSKTGNNTYAGDVLFIDPASGYAIRQFGSVWPSLKHKPMVVWTNATADVAQRDWNAEGFKGNPLPSSKTLYSDSKVPSPDAYRVTAKGWEELPGVLKPGEEKYWTAFFSGTK